LSLAALYAGNNPDNIHIIIETVVAIIITFTLIIGEKSGINVSINATAAIEISNAIIDQMSVKMIDSIKNCNNIFVLLAHIAFLIHISLVLSVTDTNMIFMIQIHHTINAIAQIHHNKRLNFVINHCICSALSLFVRKSNPVSL
jgi:hypothetical protein